MNLTNATEDKIRVIELSLPMNELAPLGSISVQGKASSSSSITMMPIVEEIMRVGFLGC